MSITPVPGVSPASTSYGAQSWAGRRPTNEAIAEALGLDPADLDRQLRAGASIAEVAAAKGVSTAKVIEAISTLMAPNADLNGDVPARVSLHKTEPVRHRPPVPHHEHPHDPRHPAPRDHRPGSPSPLAPPPPVPPPGLPSSSLAPGQSPYAPPTDPPTLNTYA
jgi:hypothetical protein